jgi:hypothetical protein
VINPRADDDTPVGRSEANRDGKFLTGELFFKLNQWLVLKFQSDTFESLKDCSRQDIDYLSLMAAF